MPIFPGHLRPKKRRWVTLLDGISNEVDVAQVSKLEADRADEFSSVTGVSKGFPLFRKRCQNMKNHGKINQKDGISKRNLSSLVFCEGFVEFLGFRSIQSARPLGSRRDKVKPPEIVQEAVLTVLLSLLLLLLLPLLLLLVFVVVVAVICCFFLLLVGSTTSRRLQNLFKYCTLQH